MDDIPLPHAMTRYFKSLPAVYESIRHTIDAGRGWPATEESSLGVAVTASSFPPEAEAPTDGTHRFLALHDWQFAGMPDAAAMLQQHLGTLILEVTAEDYRACFPTTL